MKRLWLLAALLAGCGESAPPPPPPSPAAPDFPPLPEIKAAEDFSKDAFEVLPPGDAASFAWDLRERQNHYYTFGQDSHIVITASGAGASARVTSRTRWDGGAEMVGGGGNRGELAFLAAPRAQWINDNPLSSEDLNKIPKIVIQYQVRDDGTFVSRQMKSGVEDPKLELYFALPSRPLRPGEKDVREVHIAQIAEDSRYHGKQEFTHAGRRQVGRFECVKLVSRVELEVTPPGDGTGRLVGWVAAYFATAEKRFARIEASLAMAVDARHFARPADPKEAPFWQLNHVDADLRATFVLKD